MKKLIKVEKIVEKILEENIETRKDDFKLILEVFNKINENTKYIKFSYVLQNHKAMGLPSFESITRARRKIQERRQDLVDNKTAVKREEEIEEYEEYSRS